jgi:hypothetical protein
MSEKRVKILAIVKMYEEGMTMRAIANVFDMDYRTVQYHVKKRSKSRPRGRRRNGD